MAFCQLVRKARTLFDERVAEQDRALIPKQITVYNERTKPLRFMDYFYETEHVLLRTNDFEQLTHRRKKTDKFFKNENELMEYAANLPSRAASSHDEDRPPASEELFLSDQKVYDNVLNSTHYCPPLTKMQKNLLRDLSHYIYESGDSIDRVNYKCKKRLDLIREYCKQLKRKRYAKTYRRYKLVRDLKLSLVEEVNEMLDRELFDKALDRNYYYSTDEPSEMRTILMRARSRAVQRKMKQYLTDPNFRRSMRNNVYFNVNMDVPAQDNLHMHGHHMLVYEEDADTTNASLANDTLNDSSFYSTPIMLDISCVTLPDPKTSRRATSTPKRSGQLNDTFDNTGVSEISKEINPRDYSYDPTADSYWDSIEEEEEDETSGGAAECDYEDEDDEYDYECGADEYDEAGGEYDDDEGQNEDGLEPEYEDDGQGQTDEYDAEVDDADEYEGSVMITDEEEDEAGENDWQPQQDANVYAAQDVSDSYLTEEDPDYDASYPGTPVQHGQLDDSWAPQQAAVDYGDSMNESADRTASFGSLDDEFVPSSDAELISEYDDDPITPGWLRPITHHKNEMFQQLVQIELENPTASDDELRSLRDNVVRKYHVGIIKRRRQMALERLHNVLGQNLPLQQEATKLMMLEIHDKMLNRGYYYAPDEPKEYGRLLRKRRRAVELKFYLYATDAAFRKKYKERILSGPTRPIEPPPSYE